MGIPPNYQIENFRQFSGPLIDLRSPKEYNHGHWPGAINIPLFNNEERAIVGTTYKEKGRIEAIVIGTELTLAKLPSLKTQLEKTNKENTQNNLNNTLRLYCWRGGMRSKSIGWLANMLNLKAITLNGGYKSYRRWVLSQFEKDWEIKIIGGKTGTGKTSLLLELKNRGIGVVDLEGLANHRGSSFGSLGLPKQPSNEQFENEIAEELAMYLIQNIKRVWVESESANIGSCRIPQELFKKMKLAPVLELQRSLEDRVKQLVSVYSKYGKASLDESTKRITRRLGPQRTAKAIDAIGKEKWDEACYEILDYYDRCYDYALRQAPKRMKKEITGQRSGDIAEQLIKDGIVY